jgi:cold shock CspA family protein
MTSKHSDTTSPSSSNLTGRVKWFNNKAGYGFITVTDGTHSGLDVFVHHSGIVVENQQYKYLVQGEYVDFLLEKTTSGKHEYQATNVHGINNGNLMCETRREFKIARSIYKNTKSSKENHTTSESEKRTQNVSVSKTTPKFRGEGPKDTEDSVKKEWTTVSRTKSSASNVVDSTRGRGRGRPPRASVKSNEVN